MLSLRAKDADFEFRDYGEPPPPPQQLTAFLIPGFFFARLITAFAFVRAAVRGMAAPPAIAAIRQTWSRLFAALRATQMPYRKRPPCKPAYSLRRGAFDLMPLMPAPITPGWPMPIFRQPASRRFCRRC